MSAKAVIDVGTNSVKLLVMEQGGEHARVLVDRNQVVRLGEGSAESGVLCDAAMERTASAICDMVADARNYGVDAFCAVGTQALREAANADAFLSRIETSCGLRIRVIGGEEEAELSFRAAVSALQGKITSDRMVCMFDVGGGSSEIVLGNLNRMSSRQSVAIGALSLHKICFAEFDAGVPESALLRAAALVEECLREVCRADAVRHFDGAPCCLGVGGTITTMGAVKLALLSYDPAQITGLQLDRSEVDEQIVRYASLPTKERKKIAGLAPNRADIILAGAVIVRTLLQTFHLPALMISDRGLRYGVMQQFFNLS